jgi:hypothetical protein
MVFGADAWKVVARDQFIGWSVHLAAIPWCSATVMWIALGRPSGWQQNRMSW